MPVSGYPSIVLIISVVRERLHMPNRFEICTIVRIELNSVQATEVVSVIPVVRDRPGGVSMQSFRSSEYYLRRLGRSRRSYGNQAF